MDDLRFDGKPKSYSSLDVTVLHTLILEGRSASTARIWPIRSILRYTRSFDEAVQSVRSGESACAFIINPTKIREIKAVAEDAGENAAEIHSFYPKLKTGLVMNKLL